LQYPIAHLETSQSGGPHGFYVYDEEVSSIYINPRVGWKGLDDNNPDVDVLVSYGSPDIECVNGFRFPPIGPARPYNEVHIPYRPFVRFVTRIVDPDIAASIAAQRGGTGIIEYEMKDDSIQSYNDAAIAASNFLDDNGTRAITVKFRTKELGFEPGQMMRSEPYDYYKISGNFKVGKVVNSIIADSGGLPVIECEIEASNISYRDQLKELFYVKRSTTFKINSEFPANDGIYVKNEIEIETTLGIYFTKPISWTEFEALNLTWTDFEARFSSWNDFSNVVWEDTIVANILTDAMKIRLARVINGEDVSGDVVNEAGTKVTGTNPLGTQFMAFKEGGYNNIDGYIVPVSDRVRNNNAITSVYYLTEDDQVNMNISEIDFYHCNYPYTWENATPLLNAKVPVSINRYANNPLGKYAITITKRDVVK
jgi:hypothetical protein